jgi:hypothetical protein
MTCFASASILQAATAKRESAAVEAFKSLNCALFRAVPRPARVGDIKLRQASNDKKKKLLHSFRVHLCSSLAMTYSQSYISKLEGRHMLK